MIKSKGGSGGIGVIGEHISTQNNFTCPEEEMFTINLESPVKNKTQDPDRSQDWPLLESSFHHDEAGHVSREDHHWNTRIRVEPRKTLPSATPEDRKSENVVNPTAVVQAPKKHKNHGRAEQLTRYIHKYECEDFMEYAVDIYQWKRSLEPAYQVEDWQKTQFEITPFMRYSLLDWLVSITRYDLSMHS